MISIQHPFLKEIRKYCCDASNEIGEYTSTIRSERLASGEQLVSFLAALHQLLKTGRWDPCNCIQQHQNGFLKIKLFAEREGGPQARIHIWESPGDKKNQLISDLHNHTRNFTSLVLLGNIHVSKYILDPKGATYKAFIASNRTHRASYRFVPIGEVNATESEREHLLEGSVHYAKFHSIHRVEFNRGQMAMTLFIQGPEKQTSTLVLSKKTKLDYKEDILVDADRICKTLKTAIGKLENGR